MVDLDYLPLYCLPTHRLSYESEGNNFLFALGTRLRGSFFCCCWYDRRSRDFLQRAEIMLTIMNNLLIIEPCTRACS